MNFPRLLFLLVSATPVFASLNSAVIVLPSDTNRSAPAVCLIQPADYLCAVLLIRSTAKDPEKQAAAMRETLQRITALVEKSPRFQLHQGAVHLANGANGGVLFSKAGTGPASAPDRTGPNHPVRGRFRCRGQAPPRSAS